MLIFTGNSWSKDSMEHIKKLKRNYRAGIYKHSSAVHYLCLVK